MTITGARRPWNSGETERQETPYAALAAEVIRQAVKDYIKVHRRQMRYGVKGNGSAASEARNLERFFHSDSFELYTAFLSQNLDGDAVIRQCRLRATEAEKKRTC